MNEPLLQKSYFAPRWFKTEVDWDNLEIPKEQDPNSVYVNIKEVKTKNDRERYNEAKKIGKMIEESLSRMSDKERTASEMKLMQLTDTWIEPSKDKISIDCNEESFSLSLKEGKKRAPNLRNEKDKPLKKRKVQETHIIAEDSESGNEDANEDLEKWMIEINDYFFPLTNINWTRSDFETLWDDSKCEVWLNDKHMAFACALIKQNSTQISGLQDTQSYLDYGFHVILNNNSFIQPSHTEGHWVLLSNIHISSENRSSSVNIYDSLVNSNPHLPNNIKNQICQLLAQDHNNDSEKNVNVIFKSCTQQNNSSDCGIYVIANAISLALGLNPSKLLYKGNLRKEFLEMLKEKKMKKFSHTNVTYHNLPLFQETVTLSKINVTQAKDYIISFKKKCFCRMPEAFGKMIKCIKCKKQFHLICNFISDSLTWNSVKKFYCLKCRESNSLFFGKKIHEKDNNAIKLFLLNISKLSSQDFLASLRQSMKQVRYEGSCNDIELLRI